MPCSFCLHDTKAEFNSCDRDHMACKSSNIYYFAIYRKGLQTPASKPQGYHGRGEAVQRQERVRIFYLWFLRAHGFLLYILGCCLRVWKRVLFALHSPCFSHKNIWIPVILWIVKTEFQRGRMLDPRPYSYSVTGRRINTSQFLVKCAFNNIHEIKLGGGKGREAYLLCASYSKCYLNQSSHYPVKK